MDIHYFLALIRKSWAPIAFTAVICVATVVFFINIREPSYKATAVLEIRDRPDLAAEYDSRATTPPSEIIQVLMTKIGGKEIASATAKQFVDKQYSQETISRKISAESAVSSSLKAAKGSDAQPDTINISALDSSPSKAIALANSFSDTCVKVAQNYEEEGVETSISVVDKEIDAYKVRMNSVGQQIDLINLLKGQVPSVLTAEWAQVTESYGRLVQRKDELELLVASKKRSPMTVLLPARTAGSNEQPAILIVALGLLAGLVLGVGLITVRDYSKTFIQKPVDIGSIFDLPVLGRIRLASKEETRPSYEREDYKNNDYVRLRTNLGFISGKDKLKSIMFAPVSTARSSQEVLGNTAVALARGGLNVAVVCCNLSNDRLLRMLYKSDEQPPGLSDLMTNSQEIRDFIFDTSISRLTIVPPGTASNKLDEIFDSRLFGDLISILRERFDMVLIDTPVVNESPDAAILAQFMDGVVLIADEDTATPEIAAVTKEQLSIVQSKIIGLIVAGKG